jgi:pSer/pThr/pTyr-binding forkhead associated (FHA) protein
MPVKLHVVMTIPGKDPREFEYEFDQDRITIGRDQTNDIQVPLSTVSRNHCVLFNEGGEWWLEDLKSTHGTKHNTRPVGQGGKKLLRDGDVVELVHFKITFEIERALAPDYSVERTEALARKMVEEVLASIGKEGEAPYLRVMNGPDEGKLFDISADVSEATVGRGGDCDFQVNDPNISRRHAVVRRDWNEITIEDAGSKNGVVINDRRIGKPTPLRDADEILLGSVRLTFIDPSAKFLGKLDDIPAFADVADRDDEGSDVDDEAPPDADDGPRPPPPQPTPPSAVTRTNQPGPHTVPLDRIDDEDDEDADDEDDVVDGDEPVRKPLGVFEISLIAFAVVALVGLGVGVALLFL